MISVKGFTCDSRGVEFSWQTKKIYNPSRLKWLSLQGWVMAKAGGGVGVGQSFGAKDPTQIFLKHIVA